MSAETQNTIILLAIIASVAILSLAVLPMLRRRLAGRAAETSRRRPTPEVPADRLAAIVGAMPTLSAPVPAGGHALAGPPPPARAFPEGHHDGVDSVAVAGAGTAPAGAEAESTTPESDDQLLASGLAGHGIGGEMDESAERTTTLHDIAIAPEDELATATIDALLSARRPAEPEAEAAAGSAPAGPGVMGTPVMAAVAGGGIPEPTIDPETGLDTPMVWTNAVILEEARSSRYGRPVAVVIAELDGLDRLAERFGQDAADRLIPPVADALRRNARAADRVARLGHDRFGVLLVETDEIRAINYVERVRAACDRWLEAGAVAVRLSMGWASPATDGDLRGAVRIAEERMHREQHRPAPWRASVGAPSSTEG